MSNDQLADMYWVPGVTWGSGLLRKKKETCWNTYQLARIFWHATSQSEARYENFGHMYFLIWEFINDPGSSSPFY